MIEIGWFKWEHWGLLAKSMKILSCLAGWVALSFAASSATFTVTSTLDDGLGSLRWAITNANDTPGSDVITFNIAAPGVQTITPSSPLPDITAPVTIDGYTQPGASPNSSSTADNAALRIELSGADAGPAASGLTLAADNCTVRGLAINRFSSQAILVRGASNLIAGNFLGTDATGTVAPGEERAGIWIDEAQDNLVGGTSLAARNVVAGHPSSGIEIGGGAATGNRVEGNFIGTDASGAAGLGTRGDGIWLHRAPSNTIGGAAPGAGNLISGNTYGVFIFSGAASNNTVQGNRIGTQADGVNPLPNVFGVVFAAGASGNLIGGRLASGGNLIAHCLGYGVSVDAVCTNNAVLGNAIFANGGSGIDLGIDGITPNDAGDADGGPNGLQNFPALISATTGSTTTTILGTLNTVPNTTFRLEFDTANAGFVPSISFLGFQILPEHILGAVDPAQLEQHPFFQNPTVASGPFKFVKYETDQFVQVERNPNFYGTPAKLERIFVHIATSDVATAQLQKGEILHTQISVTDADTLKNVAGVKVANKPAAGIFLMAPLFEGPKFNDKRVRQALVYAIDREGIVKQVLKGYGRVVNSHIIGPEWAINPNLNKYEYNPEKAKALLAEANWDPNTPVVINWMAGQGGRDVENSLLIAQSQLQAVGIKADFQPLERGPLLEAITGRKFDLVSYGGGVYTVDPDSTSYVLMCQFAQPKGANNPGYCNPQVDTLFMRGRGETDQAKRAAIYQEASALINDDVSHVWLFVADAIYGYSDKLQGLKPHGDFNSAYWNANEWSVAS